MYLDARLSVFAWLLPDENLSCSGTFEGNAASRRPSAIADNLATDSAARASVVLRKRAWLCEVSQRQLWVECCPRAGDQQSFEVTGGATTAEQPTAARGG
jgi:hypothetical protein